MINTIYVCGFQDEDYLAGPRVALLAKRKRENGVIREMKLNKISTILGFTKKSHLKIKAATLIF